MRKQDQVEAGGDAVLGGGDVHRLRPPVSRRTVGRAAAEEPELDPGPLDSRQGALRRRQYSISTLSLLTRRYVKVRGDLLVSIGDGTELTSVERRYAQRCSEYLHQAKSHLQSRRANFFVCSNLLFLADVTLVWLYPYGNLGLRCDAVTARLRSAGPEAQWLTDALEAARKKDDDRFLRSALEDALNHLQEFEQDDAIADDLQVTRLRMLLLYMTGALVMLFLVAPYAVIDLRASQLRGWPVATFENPLVTQWVSAAAVCAVGAVGGILSGLLATRDATTTLLDYRASILRLALKPLVGAVAALTLYFFLTWQVLTGVEVTSGGTFLLVGFLAGFSERYFLRILKAEETAPETRDGRRASAGAAGSPATSAPPSSNVLNERPFDDTPHSCPAIPTARQHPSSTAGTG
ncbi:hypothetical protein [Modestobacter marinus]|uniref:hypothetical protein n=1 Tax=Modestobacter marinus TaxID=477641 RepID=UPI001C93E02A|nr:hypothetical protein [Modestobacter marinus]